MKVCLYKVYPNIHNSNITLICENHAVLLEKPELIQLAAD